MIIIQVAIHSIRIETKELEYLLNHDPIKDMDSILEDSVDENYLNDTISKMFTDEHALDYSSPPLWDDYDDDLFDHETVNDDTYDDPFDFKEEKIKESKLLIDELDLPESNNVLPFPQFTNFATPDKNVKKTTNASLILEDFNPPLYELPFHKKVLGLGALSKTLKILESPDGDFSLLLPRGHLSLGCSMSPLLSPFESSISGD
ncbi:hypothetical protein Tco_0126998 [Tanacetum coccineum]